MSGGQGTVVKSPAREEAKSKKHRPAPHFSEGGARLATALGVFLPVAIVGANWASAPDDERSWKHLLSVLLAFGKVTNDGGWGAIGIAVSLVAVAVTAVAIVGLGDPDPRTMRRRNLVMSLADVFVSAALGILVAAIAASAFGYVAEAWKADEDVPPHQGVGLLVITAAAVVLWICVRAAQGYLRSIALSDEEQANETSQQVDDQIAHYKALERKARADFVARKKAKKDPASHNEQAENFPAPSRLPTLWRTLTMSVVWVLLASIAAGVAVWIPWPSTSGLDDAWSRSFGVMGGTVLLASIQVVFSAIPYLFSFQALTTGEAGWKRIWKFIGAIVFCSPMVVIVPISAIAGIFSPGAAAPLWKRVLLCVLVFSPTILSFAWPRRYSWGAVSALNSLIALQARLATLEMERRALDEAARREKPVIAALSSAWHRFTRGSQKASKEPSSPTSP